MLNKSFLLPMLFRGLIGTIILLPLSLQAMESEFHDGDASSSTFHRLLGSQETEENPQGKSLKTLTSEWLAASIFKPLKRVLEELANLKKSPEEDEALKRFDIYPDTYVIPLSFLEGYINSRKRRESLEEKVRFYLDSLVPIVFCDTSLSYPISKQDSENPQPIPPLLPLSGCAHITPLIKQSFLEMFNTLSLETINHLPHCSIGGYLRKKYNKNKMDSISSITGNIAWVKISDATGDFCVVMRVTF